MDYRERRGGNKSNKVPSITGNPQDSYCFEENDSHGRAWSCQLKHFDLLGNNHFKTFLGKENKSDTIITPLTNIS